MKKFGIFLIVVFASCSRQNIKINTKSMSPTLALGDVLQLDHSAYKHVEPRRWDIVAFKDKVSGDLHVSRVVGLPNEFLDFKTAKFTIDGNTLSLPPHLSGILYMLPIGEARGLVVNFPTKVSTGAVFVLSDNQMNSYDSRFYGEIKISSILGRVFP